MKSLRKVSYVLLLFVTVSFAFASCGNKGKQNNKEEESSLVQSSSDSIIGVDALLINAEQYVGKEVSVEAVCTHICQHGGRKIFLMGSDDTKTIRVESGMDKAFSPDCVNSIVVVTGVLQEQRITEASLQKWEAQIVEQAKQEKATSHESCDSEKKARGETANTPTERIKDFREKIAKRQAEEGKEYLSFYFLKANGYEIKS